MSSKGRRNLRMPCTTGSCCQTVSWSDLGVVCALLHEDGNHEILMELKKREAPESGCRRC